MSLMEKTIIPIPKEEFHTQKFDMNYFDNIIYTQEQPTTKIIIIIHTRNMHNEIQLYLQNKFHIVIGVLNFAMKPQDRNQIIEQFNSNQINILICTAACLHHFQRTDKIYLDASYWNVIRNCYEIFNQNHTIWREIRRLNPSELTIRTIADFQTQFEFIPSSTD